MRERAIKLIILSVFMVVCVSTLGGCELSQSMQNTTMTGTVKGNEDIIEMYKEIIELHEKNLAEIAKMSEHGTVPPVELAEARANLSKVRIQLARAQGQHDAVINELRSIIDTLTKTKESFQKEVEAGQRSRDNLYKLEVAILEAKIRLVKEMREK